MAALEGRDGRCQSQMRQPPVSRAGYQPASTMGAIEKEEVFIDAASLALFDGHLNGPSLMFLIPWVSM